ncbi:MAG: hypothetical protein AAGH41_06465 [Pseudomonadota bacterium]
MFRTACLAISAIAVLSAAPAAADHNDLDTVLADARRDNDRARDVYRNPKETLEFFGIEGDMTVVEMAPGGGWYTRILLPLVAEDGGYIAGNYEPSTFGSRNQRLVTWPETFKAATEEAYPGVSIQTFTYETGGAAEIGPVADAVLFFRALHALVGRDRIDAVLADAMSILKPGGVVGVVQHRAMDDAPDDYANGSKGYLRQADVVAAFEKAGFELVKSSDVNANAKDPANWPGGVWTLPPANRGPEERRDEFLAIGESNRMTLLFRKPE